MPFTFHPFDELPDVILVKPRVFGDDRGWFMETYKKSDFDANGIKLDFPQDNHSRSVGIGILRGIHYQTDPCAQGKLVRCAIGALYDVAVDLRAGSPTYGKWVSAILSEDNKHMLWVPPGFGHAIVTLTEVTEAIYKASGEFSLEHDRSLAWNDPELAIRWPVDNPSLSEKDAKAPLLADAELNFHYDG